MTCTTIRLAFQGVLVQASATPHRQGRFSIVAPVQSRDGWQQLRFGLSDESAKLNLNTFPLDQPSGQTRPRTAVGSDGDDAAAGGCDSRLVGCGRRDARIRARKSSYYQSLTPRRGARNARLDSLEDLLPVRGVTRQLLYGEDANANGWLDEHEDQNGDGTLQLGWSGVMTLASRETNLRPNGLPKLNLNQDSLAQLYDELEGEFGETVARFVVAYRLEGPVEREAALDKFFREDLEAQWEAALARDEARAEHGIRLG